LLIELPWLSCASTECDGLARRAAALLPAIAP
jgi:hypothetical protein